MFSLAARERLMMGQNANIGQAFLAVLLIIMAAIVASVIFTLRRTRSRKTRRRGTQQEIG
jgi:flagellar biogenesis protein FliO